MIQILVLDRDRATCEAMAAGLSAAEDVDAVHIALGPDEALETLDGPGVHVDAVVASAELEDSVVLDLARTLRERDDAPKLVVTGMETTDAAILRYVEAGVDAYLTEDLSMSGLLLVLRLLQRGEVLVAPGTAYRLIQRLHELSRLLDRSGLDVSRIADLTPREREVLQLVAQRLTNQDVADRLGIGLGTVKTHVHALLGKLGVRDRQEARRLWVIHQADQGPGEG